MDHPGFSQKPEDSISCLKLVMEELTRNLECLSSTQRQTRSEEKINTILVDFISRMQNMFDNYVCFGGERDTAQLQKFFCSASQNAELAFQQKAHTDTNTTELCTKICKNLFEIFQNENSKIEKYESELFQEMSVKIISSYLKKIANYLPSLKKDISEENNLSNLADVHEILVNQLLKLAQNSFNFADKGNHVLTLFLEKLKESLDKLFLDITATGNNLMNPEMLNADFSIQDYVNCMQDFINPKNWEDYEQVVDLHCRTSERVTKMLPKEIQEDVKRRLYTFFLYLYQHYTERIDNDIKDSRALCIQLTPEFVQSGFHTISGNKTHSDKKSSLLYIRHNGSKRDRLAEHDVLYHVKHCMVFGDISRHALIDLFQLTYKAHRKSMGHDIRQLIVVIPTWLSIEQRHFLCVCAKSGGFKQVYLAHDSSMAAYQWLTGQKYVNRVNYCFVVVSIDKVGIQVEIYALNEQGKALLVALSCNNWEEPMLDSSPYFGGSFPVSRKQESFPEHYMKIVSHTFEKASSHVPDPYKNFVKAYVVNGGSAYLNKQVNLVFSEMVHLVKLHEDFHELAFHAAIKLSHSASKIRTQILDYATHINPLKSQKTKCDESTNSFGSKDVASKTVTSENRENQLLRERKEKLLNRSLTLRQMLEQGEVSGIVKNKIAKVLNDIESAEFLELCTQKDLVEKEKMLDKLTANFISK